MEYRNEFEKDVIQGLRQPQKSLSSKYLYDEKGDSLFQQIMNLEEYYLPECELEILRNQTLEIAKTFPFERFDVVELGAGDGSKTLHFLKQLVEAGKEITYYPMDISEKVLETNQRLVSQAIPNLPICPVHGDYFKTLESIKRLHPKMMLFMGSNIGNYPNSTAVNFLKLVGGYMQPNDLLLVGIDLRKNPNTIVNAYNDNKGITREFNLNLLKRINRELNGTFQLSDFDHYPYYDPIAGIMYSYLVSLKHQSVKIGPETIQFRKHELLHTEVSQKYSLEEIEAMSKQAGFRQVDHFLDSKEHFTISALKK